MKLEFNKIVEGIDIVDPAGIDDTHEDISNLSSMKSFVEVGVLSITDRNFQGSLRQVVVAGSSRNT